MGIPGRPAEDRQPSLPLLAPMLAVTAPTLPDRQDLFGFEPKIDGFRCLTYVDQRRVRVLSRTGKPMHPWLPELAALGEVLSGQRTILDGEVTALVDGRPSIEALQQRMRTRRPTRTAAPALLWVFDLLYLDDTLLIQRPYRHRRQLLQGLNLRSSVFQTIPALFGKGEAMLAAAQELELEGVMAKRLDAAYTPGRRSRSWLKILYRRRLQLLVGGYVPSPAGVAALLVGQPHPTAAGRLRPVGRIDHGFTPRTRRQLQALLAPLETPRSPFTGPVGGGGWGRPPGPPPRWIRPVVEVVVEHIGREPSGRLRHPTYAGLA